MRIATDISGMFNHDGSSFDVDDLNIEFLCEEMARYIGIISPNSEYYEFNDGSLIIISPNKWRCIDGQGPEDAP